MDNERLDELFDRYLDRDLSAAEESELASMLARPECQEQWRRLTALEGKIQEELLVPAAPKKSTRRTHAPGTPPYGLFALAAAGVLVAAIWILSSGPDPETPAKNDARRKAAAAADADAKRRSREARLQEIEQKRKALEAVPPPPSESPELKQKREKELQDLKSEKERTERELREAIELARKNTAPPPVAPNPTPEEKPAAPQEPPKEPKETPRTETMVATVERVEGPVSIVGKEGNAPALKGQGILPGQGVEIGAKGFLAIKFVDGTIVEMDEETVARELKAEGGKRIRLEKGKVKAQVAKQPKDQPMVLSAPQGDAKVLGTTLRLAVDPDPKKGTKLEVEEGKVELKNLAGKTVLVESGHYAVAATGAEFVAKSSLDDPAILVAHWTFDEAVGATVTDSVSRLSGTLKNGTARVAGKLGRALYFDGVDDQVEFAVQPSFDGMSEITVSAWILLLKLPPPSQFFIPLTKEQSYRLTVDPAGGVSFTVATESNGWSPGVNESGSKPLPLNAWGHVAGTYDGKQIRMYSNGLLGETKSSLSGAVSRTGSLLTLVEILPNSNIAPFNGMMDDVRIYKRALSQAEIQTLASGRVKSGSK